MKVLSAIYAALCTAIENANNHPTLAISGEGSVWNNLCNSMDTIQPGAVNEWCESGEWPAFIPTEDRIAADEARVLAIKNRNKAAACQQHTVRLDNVADLYEPNSVQENAACDAMNEYADAEGLFMGAADFYTRIQLGKECDAKRALKRARDASSQYQTALQTERDFRSI